MDESLPKRCASHSGENEFSGSKVISPTQATPITVYKKVNCNESYSAATTNCHYINGNALHHNKLIMAILTDQLPFSTENLDGRRETNMYLFPSIQSPLGVLSHSHHMWNISTWQVNFDLATCCTVKQVIVINTEGETIVQGVREIMSLWCHCLGCTAHVQRSLYLCS